MDTSHSPCSCITLGSLATLDPAIAQSDIAPKLLCIAYNCLRSKHS